MVLPHDCHQQGIAVAIQELVCFEAPKVRRNKPSGYIHRSVVPEPNRGAISPRRTASLFGSGTREVRGEPRPPCHRQCPRAQHNCCLHLMERKDGAWLRNPRNLRNPGNRKNPTSTRRPPRRPIIRYRRTRRQAHVNLTRVSAGGDRWPHRTSKPCTDAWWRNW